jgi:hypothetical protein
MLKRSRLLAIFIASISTISFLLTSCHQASTSTTSPTTTIGSIESATPSSISSMAKGSTTKAIVSIPSPVVSTSSTAEKIAAKSITAIAKLQSFKFGMDFAMSSDFPIGGQTSTMTIQQTATGLVDILNKEVAMNAIMGLEIPSQAQQNVSAEIYIENGWIYTGTAMTGVTEQWSKMDLTDEMWAAQSQISSLTGFLDNPISLDLVGSENVNGTDCYVLSIYPEANALSNWMQGQMRLEQANVNLNSLDLSQILQNFTVKDWIAKDSYLPVKQQIGVNLDTSSIQTTSSADNTQMNINMNATLTYSDYDQPASIQLPPGAVNATALTAPP